MNMQDFHSQTTTNILDALDRKNSIQKEIAKDIILHKVHKPVANATDGAELKYMFIVSRTTILCCHLD